MPLNCQRECRRCGDAESLDQAVGRIRLDDQPLAEPIDPLPVQGIDARARPPGERAQQPTGFKRDLMSRPVLHVQGLSLIVTMIKIALHLVHALVERAAEGDVDLLATAADSKHRHAALDCPADQRQRGRIAGRVVQRTRGTGWTVVLVRLDIRRAAGQEQPVEPLKERIEAQFLRQRGHDERQRIGCLQQRSRVLLPGHMKRMRTDHAVVRGKTNEGARRCHGNGGYYKRKIMLIAQTRSYYAASVDSAAPRPPLAGTVQAEVCVIGGGIAGCSAALHLAERGYRPVLLEQHQFGWGASGRSGGEVIHGLACGQGKLERLIGRADARAVWQIAAEALTLTRALIERHRISCDWVDGYMLTALKPRHDRELREEIEQLRTRYDYPSVRYMPREEIRATLASERYVSAMFDANGGHLHPLAYTLGLAAAAERAGARLFEGSRALAVTPGRVRTDHGEVRARRIVLCGNAYLGSTAPGLSEWIMPVATHLIATEPLGEARARMLIGNNAAVSDMNWALDYFRRTADHRLLFGGAINYAGHGASDAREANRARMLRVFPQLADTRIEYAWGGLLDLTANRAPHFGRLAPDLYFLQGFSGHGIALASMAGRLVAEAIAGQAERFDVFARIPHRRFPGGALARRPLLALAMLYYRLRDLL